MLTVSRSVDRVFQIMELFAELRQPLSATEIHTTLKMPHSSAVSVLTRMVRLGYLDQNSENKRFFPSLRLHHLCSTVPEAIIGGNPLADLVDRIQYGSEETTSISRLDGLFTLPLYVRPGKRADAWRVTPGSPGGLATLSVVGRTLLSTMADVELRQFLDEANRWAVRVRLGAAPDSAQLMRAVEFVREHGYLCRYNLLFPGVGAISCPLPSSDARQSLAVTVAGPAERIQQRGRQIINVLLQEIKTQQRSAPHSAAHA
jgi:IclR family transcriptional regulator, acetate operon repressor